MDDDQKFMAIAMEECEKSFEVGGIPVRTVTSFLKLLGGCNAYVHQYVLIKMYLPQVGAALVSIDGKILGQGRNLRVQEGSPIKHV